MSNQLSGLAKRPGKIFAISAGVGALACAGFFAYEYVAGRNNATETDSGQNYLPVYEDQTTKKITGGTTKKGADDFPLRKGSSGAHVRELQEALSRYLGSSVFSKFTKIDGIFGSGTESALKYANMPTEVDERLYVTLLNLQSSGGGSDTTLNPTSAAQKLHEYADARNLQGVLSVLGQMRSTADYTAVNEPYKDQRIIATTIVTDLLNNAFAGNESAKASIKAQFVRIGLRLDATTGKWSLSGLRGFMDVVANRDTIVVDGNKNQMRVKRNTILGEVIQERDGLTFFKSIDNLIAAVPTAHVNYL